MNILTFLYLNYLTTWRIAAQFNIEVATRAHHNQYIIYTRIQTYSLIYLFFYISSDYIDSLSSFSVALPNWTNQSYFYSLNLVLGKKTTFLFNLITFAVVSAHQFIPIYCKFFFSNFKRLRISFFYFYIFNKFYSMLLVR